MSGANLTEVSLCLLVADPRECAYATESTSMCPHPPYLKDEVHLSQDCSYTTVYVYHHTPLGRFSMVDISTAVGIVPPVPKKKRTALEKSRREKAFRTRIYRSVLALLAPSWLSSSRAWKTAPGVCNIRRPMQCTVRRLGVSAGISKLGERLVLVRVPSTCTWFIYTCLFIPPMHV